MDLKDWLSAAEARCERASKGPWRTERRSVFADNPSRYIAEMQRAVELHCLRDAEFIAAARSDLPKALGLLRKALAVVSAAREVRLEWDRGNIGPRYSEGEWSAETARILDIFVGMLAAFDAAVKDS